jgi:uridine kinase
VIEKAMEQLPFRAHTVVTPVDVEAKGKTLAAESLCGVTIIRSGGPLERGLTRVIRDAILGSLM